MGMIAEAVKQSIDIFEVDDDWRFMIRDYKTYEAVRNSYFYTDTKLKGFGETFQDFSALYHKLCPF